MDGLTVVLTIKTLVNPGVPNHIKLAIADTADTALDSNVFIKAGSFSAPIAPIMKVFNPIRFVWNPKTKTYDGVFTLVNVGTDTQEGPMWVVFKKLLAGQKIVNVHGTTSGGLGYIKVAHNIAAGKSVKLLLKLKNPLKKPLNPFYFAKNMDFTAVDPTT
jgi:hypothetical protein